MEIHTVKDDAPREPASEHPMLLTHQLATLKAMHDIETNSSRIRVSDREMMSVRYGILADKPGSGKSYVIAELMLGFGTSHIPAAEPVRITVSPYMSIISDGAPSSAPLDVTVVVVPHNIVLQWTGVLRHFTGEEPWAGRYGVVSKSSDMSRTVDVLERCREEQHGSETKVLLVSAGMYPDIIDMFTNNGISAGRVVFDEADSLRYRAASAPTVGRFYWFVTASIHNLFSGAAVGQSLSILHSNGAQTTKVTHRGSACKSVQIWSFFANHHVALSRFVSRVVVVTDNAFIDRSFDISPPETVVVRCTAPLHTRVLSGIAPNEVVRRLNAGDLEVALMYMRPDHADNENNIIAAALSKLNVDLENARAELDFITRRRYATQVLADAAVERQTARVARCEQSIINVRERIRGATECFICYSDMRNKTVVPCCNNSFCLACITAWVASTPHGNCPVCKSALSTTDFMVCCERPLRPAPVESYLAGGVEFDSILPKNGNLAKLLLSVSQCHDRASRKLLFFCDNEYAIDNSGRQSMRDAGIPCHALKGNSAVINKTVKDFIELPGPRALLVNCSYYGCGLNLSVATDVIIYHAVDSRMDQQIIGRAQRPPRATALRVWRFVNCTELQEGPDGLPAQ